MNCSQKILQNLFILVACLGIVFNFSCAVHFRSHKAVKSREKIMQEKTQKKKHREKLTLEFAFAGGMFASDEQQGQENDSATVKPPANKPLTKTVPRKKTKKDSLFEAMVQRAKRLREADKNRTVFQPVDITKIGKSDTTTFSDFAKPPKKLSAPKPRRRRIVRRFRKKPVTARKTVVQKEKAREIFDYNKIVSALRKGKNPVLIKIGSGKRYWISTLAEILFPLESPGFRRTLDWVIQNNRQFTSRRDLDFVRAGDKIRFPAKKTIDRLLFAKK